MKKTNVNNKLVDTNKNINAMKAAQASPFKAVNDLSNHDVHDLDGPRNIQIGVGGQGFHH